MQVLLRLLHPLPSSLSQVAPCLLNVTTVAWCGLVVGLLMIEVRVRPIHFYSENNCEEELKH